MSIFWPPSWFRKKKRAPVVAPTHGHREIAAEFFWLPKKEQLQVLYYLGVDWHEQHIVLSESDPYNDVKEAMVTMGEPEKLMTSEMYLDRLKAIHLVGRGYHVEAAFHNIFRDRDEAKHYADRVLKWG